MADIRKRMTRTRWEGLVFMLVAAGYLWEIRNIPSFYEVPGVPGPSAFPELLGVVFGLTGLWLFIAPDKTASGSDSGETDSPHHANELNDGPRSGFFEGFLENWQFYAIWILILGYLILWPILGFPIATFGLLVLFFYLMDEKRWWVLIGLSLISTAVIYIFFAKGLNVHLGLGLLEPLFK
jgi:hypothetical protein